MRWITANTKHEVYVRAVTQNKQNVVVYECEARIESLTRPTDSFGLRISCAFVSCARLVHGSRFGLQINRDCRPNVRPIFNVCPDAVRKHPVYPGFRSVTFLSGSP